jgi:two-component system response regulator HydG
MALCKEEQSEARIVGVSEAIKEVVHLADMVAQSDCSLVIEGDSGTGKELIARRVHQRSPRCTKPFLPVNCAGITESLFESQFFGHVRGAFTGAEQTMLGLVRTADEGTLFLDEVGDIPLGQQPKMLRLLQEGEVLPVGAATQVQVNVRFVAASNRCLRDEVRAGRFRQDLFYRLNVVRIHIPPLRERREDIECLLNHFLEVFSQRYHRIASQVSTGVRRRLAEYSWPGNVRELASWVDRLFATGYPAELLLTSLLEDEDDATDTPADEEVLTLQQAEKHAINRALKASDNNQRLAAQMLQVHRTTLSRKLVEYNMA